MLGREDGPPPPVDLDAERRHGEFVRGLIGDALATAVHDVSDGGLLVALAEMALAGKVGVKLDTLLPLTAPVLFGEDQARYLITTDNSDPFVRACAASKIPHVFVGSVGDDAIVIGKQRIALRDLRAAHEAFFPTLMDG